MSVSLRPTFSSTFSTVTTSRTSRTSQTSLNSQSSIPHCIITPCIMPSVQRPVHSVDQGHNNYRPKRDNYWQSRLDSSKLSYLEFEQWFEGDLGRHFRVLGGLSANSRLSQQNGKYLLEQFCTHIQYSGRVKILAAVDKLRHE